MWSNHHLSINAPREILWLCVHQKADGQSLMLAKRHHPLAVGYRWSAIDFFVVHVNSPLFRVGVGQDWLLALNFYLSVGADTV